MLFEAAFGSVDAESPYPEPPGKAQLQLLPQLLEVVQAP